VKNLALLSLFITLLSAQTPDPAYQVRALRIQVLSTMLTSDQGIGEWGFAAVVEADGHRILFDTGARPDTVLNNAKELGVDLSNVTEVVLSHNHADHTGGLMTLRRALSQKNPAALSQAYVAKGIFAPRRNGPDKPLVFMPNTRRDYEAGGGHFMEFDHPVELWNGVWLTGPVPRKYPERNWSGKTEIQTAEGWKEDTLPEDMSMVVNTGHGLVVLAGCGHAGIVNTLEYARSSIRNAPIHAAVGGFHLFQLDDEKLRWTAAKLKEFGLSNFLGAHCTGIEAVYRIRDLTGLDRKRAAVAAVGAVYDLDKGLDPGSIAR
jgi:7,8-dihydropterin-6-yl-methyl-4-(beta-D-ribofuranosyl)aminobenzene 5'-phosphate synthase